MYGSLVKKNTAYELRISDWSSDVCSSDLMAARREDSKKRPPNPQARLLETWRAVHAAVCQRVAGPLAIGGKSMGGRMASLLADELGADALVCLGYPFHRTEQRRVG